MNFFLKTFLFSIEYILFRHFENKPTSIIMFDILWMAPFYSGGGYSSEAFAFINGMVEFGGKAGTMGDDGIGAMVGCHFGDSPKDDFMEETLNVPGVVSVGVGVCYNYNERR